LSRALGEVRWANNVLDTVPAAATSKRSDGKGRRDGHELTPLLYLWCNLAFAIRRRRPTSTAKHNRERINTHGSVSRRRPASIIWGQVAAEGLKGPIEVPRLKRSNVHQQPHKSNRRRTFPASRMYRNYFHRCYLGRLIPHQAYFILLPRYLSFCWLGML
jgi:hypothetical protein